VAFSTLLDVAERLAKVAAIVGAGAWVYLNTIRGRTFIPRLQTKVSGKVLRRGDAQYLFVDMQVQNVGSSVAWIKAKGTGLKVSPMKAMSSTADMIQGLDTDKEQETAFPVFGLAESDPKPRAVEPGTIIYSQEMVEVPRDHYDGFRIELSVSALGGWWQFFSRKNRKWRAFCVALEDKAAAAETRKGE
jgi:hypothetical protein